MLVSSLFPLATVKLIAATEPQHQATVAVVRTEIYYQGLNHNSLRCNGVLFGNIGLAI